MVERGVEARSKTVVGRMPLPPTDVDSAIPLPDEPVPPERMS